MKLSEDCERHGCADSIVRGVKLEQERDKYKELWEKCDKCLNNEFDKNVREKFARDGMKACVEGAVKDADKYKNLLALIAENVFWKTPFEIEAMVRAAGIKPLDSEDDET